MIVAAAEVCLWNFSASRGLGNGDVWLWPKLRVVKTTFRRPSTPPLGLGPPEMVSGALGVRPLGHSPYTAAPSSIWHLTLRGTADLPTLHLATAHQTSPILLAVLVLTLLSLSARSILTITSFGDVDPPLIVGDYEKLYGPLFP